ncbi:hypothetical protein MTBBW1_760005 [Desulfamplus magnetovallimortis]|uniref:Uncharacterized protein n=1 Tax=Desulfamplus magnetovallimortis TaxID=1246637 RepID=A0A1W1HJ62_9BACT|nr:hypothetical protein MTBBW1_760005 [Desulfamplus magnetovallimortis]
MHSETTHSHSITTHFCFAHFFNNHLNHYVYKNQTVKVVFIDIKLKISLTEFHAVHYL